MTTKVTKALVLCCIWTYICFGLLSCTKDDMNDIECETYYQVTIEVSDNETYTTFVFEDDDVFDSQYGDMIVLDGREGVIEEKLPFNTCPEKQPYL